MFPLLSLRKTIAVITLIFSIALPAGAQTDRPIVKGDVGRTLHTYLSRLAKLGFSGAIVAEKDGEIVLAHGYGLADREKGIPVTTETVFTIGSITKQFTAAAILKLEMMGKLRTTDPLSKYLPGVPEDKKSITLHHLLTHSAGLRPNYGESDFEPVSRDEIIRRVMSAPLLWPPGSRYRYSNAGYSLLGAIMEIVSGMNYEEFLRKHLFLPAGMTQTGYRLPKWRPEQIAVGYDENGECWGTVLERPWAGDGPYWNLRANGGIHSTIYDMLKWYHALQTDAVLSEEAKKKFFTPYIREGEGADSFYAYGWAIFTTPRNTRLIAHNGGNGIYAADFCRFVDENAMYFIASNARPSAIEVSNSIERILFGMPFSMPPEVKSLSPAELRKYAGEFRLESGDRLSISAQKDRLTAVAHGRNAFALLHGGGALPEWADSAAVRTQQLLAATLNGDYSAISKAFGGEFSPQHVERMHNELWNEWQERFGAYEAFEAAGSYRRHGGVAVILKIRFAHGVRYLLFQWEGPQQLAGIRPMAQLPRVELFPVGDDRFVSFRIGSRSSVRVQFHRDARGAVEGMEFEPGGPRATRVR